jgi:hypothetical protein
VAEYGDFNEMLELRQRSRSPASYGSGYHRVNTEDELDEIPTLLINKPPKAVPKNKSTACKYAGHAPCYITPHHP